MPNILGLLIGVAMLLMSPPLLQAQDLPGEISNAEFWRIVTEFSEPGANFTDTNSDNLLSNEFMFQVVMPRLEERATAGGAYLGVGPEQNFTYIAALKPRIAFILDIRRQNMVEMLLYKALFELSSDRLDFVSRLFSRKFPPSVAGRADLVATIDALMNSHTRLLPDLEYYMQNRREIKEHLTATKGFALTEDDLDRLDYVYSAFYFLGPKIDFLYGTATQMPTYAALMTERDATGVQRSYLANDENFKVVQDLQKKNMIIPLVADFAGPKAIRSVAQYLKDHRANVSAFYVSNVEQYLDEEPLWSNYIANIKALPTDTTSTFIRSATRSVIGGIPFRPTTAPSRGIFLSVLSSMTEVLDAHAAGNVRNFIDVMTLSQ